MNYDEAVEKAKKRYIARLEETIAQELMETSKMTDVKPIPKEVLELFVQGQWVGHDPETNPTDLAAYALALREALDTVRSLPLFGFVQCAWVDTRQTALPNPAQVMRELEAWEKTADNLLGDDQ